MSVAGGLPRAVDRAVAHGCEALQIFTKNASQWRGRMPATRRGRSFARRSTRQGMHAGRVARQLPDQSGDDQRGAARRNQLRRWATSSTAPRRSACSGVVLHPGCYTAAASEAWRSSPTALLDLPRARRRGKDDGAARTHGGPGHVARRHVRTARRHHRRMNGHARVGVCLDTCHLLASGYDIVSPEGYASDIQACSGGSSASIG